MCSILQSVCFFFQFPEELELRLGRRFHGVLEAALMGDFAHLGVGGGVFNINATAFFKCVQPGFFVNGQNASSGAVHHDIVRPAVVAYYCGRACRHGFDDYVAEGIRGTREQEEI